MRWKQKDAVNRETGNGNLMKLLAGKTEIFLSFDNIEYGQSVSF